jgi:protein-tyrosine kinase
VRSQLMLRWFNTDPAHKVIAIVSPGSGEGRSFIAANLAIVFAQQGERTLLIDADLRAKPARAQNALFKLGKSAGLSGILANRAGLEVAQLVPGLPGLAVLPAGATPPNPQELLGRPAFGALLRIASQQFDVIIIDTPAGTEFADAEVTAARAGAALLVARKNKSLVPQANQLARRLQDSGVALVGSVLNDA